MISKNITINIPSQADTSPAAYLVQIACQFESKIYLEVTDKKINAKSIMGMMSLSIIPGREITVTAQGSDEEAAMGEIEKYLTSAANA